MIYREGTLRYIAKLIVPAREMGSLPRRHSRDEIGRAVVQGNRHLLPGNILLVLHSCTMGAGARCWANDDSECAANVSSTLDTRSADDGAGQATHPGDGDHDRSGD